MSGFTFRTAVEADLERLIDVHTSAFPDPRGALERRKNFVANPRGGLDSLHVVEQDGELVGHGFLFFLRAWFAGGAVSLGAIASIGVAPEARGRGVGAALVGHLHTRADLAKVSVTMLYPFRQAFYAKHGYAPVTPNRRLRFNPASVPSAWRAEPGITVRAVRADPRAPTADRRAILRAYERAAARTHGWATRPTALWDRHLANERRVWLLATRRHERRVSGYVCWSLDQSEPHAPTRMLVHELIADDDASRRALLGAIGAQRDQVAEVELEIDARDPLDHALIDADRHRFGTSQVEHSLGAITGGPMVRLVDVARGLTTRAYANDGAVDLVVDGRAPLHLAVTGGRAKLSVPKGAPAPLAIARPALGAVLYGGLSICDAVRLGSARADQSTIARAEALFASPPFFALDAY